MYSTLYNVHIFSLLEGYWFYNVGPKKTKCKVVPSYLRTLGDFWLSLFPQGDIRERTGSFNIVIFSLFPELEFLDNLWGLGTE
jgi:hypothetical protein